MFDGRNIRWPGVTAGAGRLEKRNMDIDSDNQQLADSRRHHQRARVRRAAAWLAADTIELLERGDSAMKPAGTEGGKPQTDREVPEVTAPLGPLQKRLLDALRRHGRNCSLQSLAALAAGIIPDLNACPPFGWMPPRAGYVATARAIAALRRRGLVTTRMIGTTKGRIEWPTDGKPVWRFRNPSTRLVVSLVVDSLVTKS